MHKTSRKKRSEGNVVRLVEGEKYQDRGYCVAFAQYGLWRTDSDKGERYKQGDLELQQTVLQRQLSDKKN